MVNVVPVFVRALDKGGEHNTLHKLAVTRTVAVLIAMLEKEEDVKPEALSKLAQVILPVRSFWFVCRNMAFSTSTTASSV